MGLSVLGIFHTIIGVIAIIAAIVAYVRFGKINLNKLSGKIYFYCTLAASVTALGLSSVKGFNPGHGLAVLIVISIVISYYLDTRKSGKTKARYWENFLLSFSFFLSMIPTINETLTRVPVGKPFAQGPTDPLVVNTLGIMFVLFIVGSVYQFIQQRKVNSAAAAYH